MDRDDDGEAEGTANLTGDTQMENTEDTQISPQYKLPRKGRKTVKPKTEKQNSGECGRSSRQAIV